MVKKHAAIKAIEEVDKDISRKAAGAADGWSRIFHWTGELTDQPPLYAMSAGVIAAGLVRRDARVVRTGLRMVCAHAIGIAAKTIVKKTIVRTRPNLLIDEGHYESGKGNHDEKPYNSFPSGHTVGAVAIARAVAREFPNTGHQPTASPQSRQRVGYYKRIIT